MSKFHTILQNDIYDDHCFCDKCTESLFQLYERRLYFLLLIVNAGKSIKKSSKEIKTNILETHFKSLEDMPKYI